MLNQINLSSTWISSSRIHAFQMRLKYGKQSRVFGGCVPPWPPHRATGGGREGGREAGSRGEDGTHAVGEEPLHCKRQKINSHAFTPTGNFESD